MRLWSLHPRYLDAQGLVALWREALLAQAVLAGKTRGYKHHPQLRRFQESPAPRKYIAEYLKVVQAEGERRLYHFDARKIGGGGNLKPLAVTDGQLAFEWEHLRQKLRERAPRWLRALRGVETPEPHPLFRAIEGGVEEWEVGASSPR
ncbi:MAG: pyrimidine dimer DNA glycosylase/endonuclease V [Chloroflexota bacterium]